MYENKKNKNKHNEAEVLRQRLENYKKTQSKIAKSRGDDVYKDLMRSNTLTQARIAVYGKKDKCHMTFRGHPEWEDKKRIKIKKI